MPTASSSKTTLPGSSRSKHKTASKPYDRTLSAPVTSLKPSSSEELGAPATLSQKSRKGKKAWRKNIDTREEEEAMEQAREEERVTGGRYSEKKDGDLFTVDTVGDVEVAKRMKRQPKPLRSLAVLSETTAIPSLTSRSTTPSAKKAKPLSKAEKVRLRRIARKELPDGEEHVGAGEIKVDSSFPLDDAWDASVPPVSTDEFGAEGMIRAQVKAPRTLAEQRRLRQGRLENGLQLLDETPEAGTSYNPTAESHAALMEKAIEEEMALLKKEVEQEEQIRQLGEVVVSRKIVNADGSGSVGEYAEGMRVDTLSDSGADSDSEEVDESSKPLPKKPSVRKTQAQRNKALRRREAAQALEREKRMKTIHKNLGASAVAKIKKEAEARLDEMREKERMAKLVKKEKERMGLEGGEKICRFKVGKKRVDVQLGEDLAESLRQVKPEGNLFKDRFLALQKKALVEPRMPQLPTRRVRKSKEYEKHAWKDFK